MESQFGYNEWTKIEYKVLAKTPEVEIMSLGCTGDLSSTISSSPETSCATGDLLALPLVEELNIKDEIPNQLSAEFDRVSTYSSSMITSITSEEDGKNVNPTTYLAFSMMGVNSSVDLAFHLSMKTNKRCI